MRFELTTFSYASVFSVLFFLKKDIVSAPLWDSTKRKFAGMLTATDFINLIQFYYSHSSYTAAIREMDQFQISQLRGNRKRILLRKSWGAEGPESVEQAHSDP